MADVVSRELGSCCIWFAVSELIIELDSPTLPVFSGEKETPGKEEDESGS